MAVSGGELRKSQSSKSTDLVSAEKTSASENRLTSCRSAVIKFIKGQRYG